MSFAGGFAKGWSQSGFDPWKLMMYKFQKDQAMQRDVDKYMDKLAEYGEKAEVDPALPLNEQKDLLRDKYADLRKQAHQEEKLIPDMHNYSIGLGDRPDYMPERFHGDKVGMAEETETGEMTVKEGFNPEQERMKIREFMKEHNIVPSLKGGRIKTSSTDEYQLFKDEMDKLGIDVSFADTDEEEEEKPKKKPGTLATAEKGAKKRYVSESDAIAILNKHGLKVTPESIALMQEELRKGK